MWSGEVLFGIMCAVMPIQLVTGVTIRLILKCNPPTYFLGATPQTFFVGDNPQDFFLGVAPRLFGAVTPRLFDEGQPPELF